VVGVRLYPDIEDALEAWIMQQPEPKPSKPEAVRRLLREALLIKREATYRFQPAKSGVQTKR